ncbi:MAG TPA: 3'(2'),5'-bisphosphate nucleotidase CysQ [Acidimicrobiales bacterium]
MTEDGFTESDHALAARLATEAGRLLLRLRHDMERAGVHSWRIMDEGDAAAHHFLVDALKAVRPDDAILSEEGRDSANRLTANRVWIIDPLDGTNEFGEMGRSDWAVHVALVQEGSPVAAAVSLPALNRTFATDPPPPFPAVTRSHPRLVVSRHRAPYASAMVAGALGADMLRLGSAGAKAMAVVVGDADVYAHAGGMYEWDSCAPAAVAAAAGFHVSRIDGSPLVYNRPDPWLPDLLVCRPELRDAVLAALWD